MQNVGGIDRAVRGVVGVGALAFGYFYGSYWGLLGLIPLTTAIFQFCPAYSIFKINSCQNRKLKT